MRPILALVLMAAYPVGPTHPHRDAGIALLVLGIIMLIGGIAAAGYCSLSFLGVCLDYPFAGVGALAAIVGIVLLIVGLVLMFLTGPSAPAPAQVIYVQQPGPYFQPPYSPQPPYSTPRAYLAPPPVAPQVRPSAAPQNPTAAQPARAAPVAKRPRTFSRRCPSCGAMNLTADPKSTPFCQKCGKPFPPAK